DVFAGLQHPDADDERADVGGRAGHSSRRWIQLDAGSAFAEFHHDVARGDFELFAVVTDVEVGDVIGDFGNRDLGLDCGQAFELRGDLFGAAAELFFHALVGLSEEPVDGGDHAD